MLWCVFESRTIQKGTTIPSPSEKIPKWHFLTHAYNPKNFWAKILFWKCHQVTSSKCLSLCLEQRIKMDKLDYFKKALKAFEKFFLFWMPMNILESAYSFMLKCSKITVWGTIMGSFTVLLWFFALWKVEI